MNNIYVKSNESGTMYWMGGTYAFSTSYPSTQLRPTAVGQGYMTMVKISNSVLIVAGY
jgi:hypothetical protein